MNSKITKLLIITISAILIFTFAGCKKCKKDDKRTKYNNEKDTLLMSTQELDGVFNPFFSTSATDSSIVGMTQLGMISNTKDGDPVANDNEACVAKDYQIVQNMVNGQVETSTYYFVLKNNVKFSNGSPLTMKDVLFNLYVYLDPVYSGSSTIYSTDIVGLKEYRTQSATQEEQDNFNKKFEVEATQRVDDLIQAAEEITKIKSSPSTAEFTKYLNDDYVSLFPNIVDDFEKASSLFKQELEQDYSNNIDSYDSIIFTSGNGESKKEHKGLITTDVEAFLFAEGYIRWIANDPERGPHLDYILGEELTNSLKAMSKENARKEAIDIVYEDKFPRSLVEILSYWQTGVNLYDRLVSAAMEEFYKDPSTKKFPNISGIKFANRFSSVNVNGVTYNAPTYNEDGSCKEGSYEVLSIEIKKVDPKAIWNFSFIVAPLFYYSDEAHIKAFDYETNFGVEYGNISFFDEVIKQRHIGLPVGAGPYMASNADGSTTNVDPSDFWNANVIYFERNPYFINGSPKIKKVRFQVIPANQMTSTLYTGQVDFVEPNAKPELINELNSHKNDGIRNKSITTAGYGYIGINAGKVPDIGVRQAIMHAINTQVCVDYYKTTATPIYRPISRTSWAYPEGSTPYYPYIGGIIPENLNVVNPYYKEFVYEKNKRPGDTFTEEEQNEFLRNLVENAGYSLNRNGIYQKDSHVLKYTFTIAGEAADHPAWQAMFLAGQKLNNIAGDGKGFSINTTTDSTALQKLSSGNLTVWAAAWGSTIDPDMYQVYHRDSKASSTLNWGYKQILQNIGGKYDYEYGIVEKLSDEIDKAREVLDKEERAKIYEKALNLVMELAVELPTYQRDDLFAYNASKIDENTLNQDVSAFKGLTSELWNISFLER